MADVTATAGRNDKFDAFSVSGAFCAVDLPAHPDGGFRRHGAALPVLDQSLQRHAAGVDHRPARDRHDVRDPDRRHRPVGRLVARLRRPRRGGGRQGRHAGPLHGGRCRRSAMAGHLRRWQRSLVGRRRRYIQGLAITRLKVPPFVVTLGGMSVFRGAALLFAAGGPISGFQPDFAWWGQGDLLQCLCPSSSSSSARSSPISC